MKKSIFFFNFGRDFKLFFFKRENFIILKKKSRYFFLKLPYIYFFNLKNKVISFIFLNYFHYISFFKHIVELYNKLSSFYYLRLQLKGLGYRIIHITNHLIKIFFNRSNFFYIYISSSILLKNRTRRLFFISTSNEVLSVTIISILYLKEFVIYRQHGLYYPRQILLIKPGKNKFR